MLLTKGVRGPFLEGLGVGRVSSRNILEILQREAWLCFGFSGVAPLWPLHEGGGEPNPSLTRTSVTGAAPSHWFRCMGKIKSREVEEFKKQISEVNSSREYAKDRKKPFLDCEVLELRSMEALSQRSTCTHTHGPIPALSLLLFTP